MKHYLILTIAICSLFLPRAFQAQGGELISPIIEQNDESFGFDHVVTDVSPLTFSLTDEHLSGKWEVNILSNGGAYVEVPSTVQSQNQCIFDPTQLTLTICMQARRFYDSSLNRDLFELQINFVSDNGIKTTRSLKIALIPGRPVISDICLTYEHYDWEFDSLMDSSVDYWDTDFSFNIKSPGATKFTMYVTDSFLFKFTQWLYCEDFRGINEAKINYPADWGEYVLVSISNQFGYVHSDTLYTTDYINDPVILARIEELRQQAGISEPTVEEEASDTFSWDNNTLTFDNTVSEVYVYDVSGHLLLQSHNVETMDLSYLHGGIYIVAYKRATNQNSILNKTKIIKR